ncbi:hypothetical protein SV7mr_50360 [Stieleria bergensis]|uniref:Uncharacterized protein n=1 Tax=Stieleria bergensis TaxID=2528025 RepID=A0A517T291_9BACT|nr:hypothetical protein SV7mr_50360 [Planctomycetes bacterium SV_7m_r]
MIQEYDEGFMKQPLSRAREPFCPRIIQLAGEIPSGIRTPDARP